MATDVLNDATVILCHVVVVVVFYGVVNALLSSGAEGKKDGIKIALFGVVAVAVMVSIWGIIRLLQNTFSVTSTAPVIPQGVQINTGI